MKQPMGLRPRPHILVIHADPAELAPLLQVMNDHHFKPSVSIDGAQGRDRALALAPDMILLDANGGHEATVALVLFLKRHPLTHTIPIMLMAEAATPQERLRGLKAGATDYVVKPCLVEELIERIKIHLRLPREAGQLLPTGLLPASSVTEQTAHAEAQALAAAARTMLDEQPTEKVNVGELADVFGVSVRRLEHAFRETLGISISEYKRTQRLRKAEHLLANSGLSIVFIAQELGFSSAANFSTAFRKHAGMAPSAYRRRHFRHADPVRRAGAQ